MKTLALSYFILSSIMIFCQSNFPLTSDSGSSLSSYLREETTKSLSAAVDQENCLKMKSDMNYLDSAIAKLYKQKISLEESLSDCIPCSDRDAGLISIPDLLIGRPLHQSNSITIADEEFLEIEVYDHQKIDRDTISLNFNGTWVAQKLMISDKPHKIRLKLNQHGTNYLVLYAENLGVIPPNTMALRYRYKEKNHEVILHSDLNQSEMILLKLESTPLLVHAN